MKKILTIITCICITFSLAACSDSTSSQAVSTASKPASSSSATSTSTSSVPSPEPTQGPTAPTDSTAESVVTSDRVVLNDTVVYSTMSEAQEAVGFEFKDIAVDGWNTSEIAASSEGKFIKVTLSNSESLLEIYKGTIKENLPALGDSFVDGAGDATFDETIPVTLGRMGGVYTYAAWESNGYAYVINNVSGMTVDEVDDVMEAIMH